MGMSDAVRKNTDVSDGEYILKVIHSLMIIDFGVISMVYQRDPEDKDFRDGIYVDVTLADNKTITNVEYLFLGNPFSSINTEPAPGQRVLIVGSRNSFTSIEEMFYIPGEKYSDSAAKCIGLGQIQSGICSLLMAGGLFFSGPESKTGVAANGDIIKRLGQGVVSEKESTDGSYIGTLGGRSFRTREPVDGGFVTEWTVFDSETASDRKVLYKETFNDTDGSYGQYEREITDVTEQDDKKWGREKHRNADGSYTDVINDADGNPLFSYEFAADGTLSIVIGEDKHVITVNQDGSSSIVQEGDWSQESGGREIKNTAEETDLGGNAKSVTMYEDLETALAQLKAALDSHVHMVSSVGSPTAPVASPFPLDISAAQSQKVKLDS